MTASPPLALYIHWPFCVSKCPYCDFNSHVREGVDQAAWRAALLADLAHEAARTRGPLGSIFFGGGTPSLMPPATVAALIEAAAAAWGFAPGIEITLEANPSSVEAARFADLAAAGVNRVSLGLQALDDAALRFLGRAHDLGEGLAALETAQRAFARVSFDLIYARPGQSAAAWAAELARAVGFGTEHLSLYQLTIEPGTRFSTEAAAGRLTVPGDEDAAALFEATRAQMAAAGLPAYEVSNHARPGAESRHNLTYWRCRDYAGIGPGAHGRLDIDGIRHAIATEKRPETWLMRVEAQGHGVTSDELLNSEERADEYLLMGLRLAEGIDPVRYRALSGRALDPRRIEILRDEGAITVDPDGRVRVTMQGFPVLDAVVADLAA